MACGSWPPIKNTISTSPEHVSWDWSMLSSPQTGGSSAVQLQPYGLSVPHLCIGTHLAPRGQFSFSSRSSRFAAKGQPFMPGPVAVLHERYFGPAPVLSAMNCGPQELLRVKLVPEPQDGEEQVPLKTGQMYAKDRDEVQTMCTGALAIMLVDKTCREPLIALEPNLATFISMCGVLPDYSDEVTAERRINTSRILCSLIQVIIAYFPRRCSVSARSSGHPCL